MMRKFNALLCLLLLVALGLSLFLTGVFDLSDDSDQVAEETEVVTESVQEVADAAGQIVAEPLQATIHEHSKASSAKENYVAATCSFEGSYDEVDYCECGEVMNRNHVEVAKKQHCYEVSVKAPGCTKRGRKIYTCVECGDSYSEKIGQPTGHNYEGGKCIFCKGKDPQYSKPHSGAEILNVLSGSVVSCSDGYEEWPTGDSLSVFAEPVENCLSFYTAVSYNLLGHNEQYVMYNTRKLQNLMKNLYLSVGGETSDSGKATIDIFIDKSVQNNEPDYSYDIDLSCKPTRIKVKVKDTESMAIRAINHAGERNRIVLFDLSSKE